MSKKNRPTAIRLTTRPGELGVQVARTIRPLPDGTSVQEIGIDFRRVPIPDRRYSADVAGAVYDGTQVKVLFGQMKVAAAGLRSLIVIAMSIDALHRFLETCEAFIPENRQFMKKYGIAEVPLVQVKEEPDQTVAMSANIVLVARSGREATADFYHASAASLHALQQSDVLGLEGVVRVDMPLGILGGLLEELVRMSKAIPQEIS